MQRRRQPRMTIAAVTGAVVLAVALLAAGCGYTHPGRPLALPAAGHGLPPARRSHLAIVVLENEEATDVIGNPHAPYLNALAHRYALADRYYGVSHPSLPNYLALTGGSTFGISSDCTDCSVNARNIVDQLEAAHVSWKAYMEDLPRPCDTTAGVAGYAKKHDPFLYYRDVVTAPARCGHVVPLTQLADDLRGGTLPRFVWITPNLCDDGHDCALSSADRFLRTLVPTLLSQLGPHGLLIVTFDEGSSDAGCCGGLAAGGRVATVLAGPDVRRGFVASAPYSHYSTLRTIEEAFGLPPLANAGATSTRPLDALLGRPLSLR